MSLHPDTLGRYRLVSLLGEGGMGKVYKAYDAALERHVAIKILPAELVTDATRVTRFVQEARAASALNHPNVVVVHDVGEAGDIHYIAMELVDGATLRELLVGGPPLEIGRAIKIVLQVAEALTAAHAAGIVHRDLKPENIMVSRAGYAKVLDFGLAKLRLRHESDANATTQIKDTDPGMMMGTAGYMSPEQALGRPVDHRSDVFSLGSIVYEMATGRRAFSGHSTVDTLHKIIYGEPEPIATHRPDAPRELTRIVRRALAKDPDDRYQSAKDLAIDLRELLRELESDSSPDAITARTEAIPERRRRRVPIAAAIVIPLAIAIAYFAFVRTRRAASMPNAPNAAMRVTRVTATGKVIAATISNDGSFVAYVLADQDEQSLWVRQMASGQSLQLVPRAHVGYWGLSFGRDGLIYYVEKSRLSPNGTIFQISPLGGTPRRIASNVEAPPTFSPDGKRMAFLRLDWPTPVRSALIVANGDGSEERTLASVEKPDQFVPLFFAGASWSPDGNSIATVLINPKEDTVRIVAIDVATGAMRVIAEPGWFAAGQVAWLPDGSGLVAIANVVNEDRSQVWFVPHPDGEAFRITNDLFDYRSVSVTSDGQSLLTVVADRTSDVWVHAAGETPRRLTSARMEGSHGLAMLADGRIVLTSLESGKPDIWIMNGDGSGRVQLTRDVHRNRGLAVTRDGRYVVYLSHTGKQIELCRIDIDGTDRRVLSTIATWGGPPAISPDGKWVVFEGIETESPQLKGKVVLLRVPIDGGAAVRLTDDAATLPSFSPDGSQIAFYARDVDPNDLNIVVMAAEGGKPLRRLRAASPFASSHIVWTPDAQALIVNTMPSDRANLWRLPLDGSKPVRLTDFEEKLLMSFAPLRDREGWVMARGDLSRDAVLIAGFRR